MNKISTALFILNQRNPLQILNSIKNWNHLNQRILKYNPELFMSYSGLDDDKKILTLIEDHYRGSSCIFQSKPTARYMEYEIQTYYIEKLYPYIPEIRGVPVFPHENIGIYRGKKHQVSLTDMVFHPSSTYFLWVMRRRVCPQIDPIK